MKKICDKGNKQDPRKTLHWFSLSVTDPLLQKKIEAFKMKQFHRAAPAFTIAVWFGLILTIFHQFLWSVNAPQAIFLRVTRALLVTTWYVLIKLGYKKLTLGFQPAFFALALFNDIIIKGNHLQFLGLHYEENYLRDFFDAFISMFLNMFLARYDYRYMIIFVESRFLIAIYLLRRRMDESGYDNPFKEVIMGGGFVLTVFLTGVIYIIQKDLSQTVIQQHLTERQQVQLNNIFRSQPDGVIVYNHKAPAAKTGEEPSLNTS